MTARRFSFLVTTLVLGFAAAAAAIWAYTHPLEASELKARYALSRAGVKTEWVEGWHMRRLRAADKPSEPRTPGPNECVVLVHGGGDQSLTWKSLLLDPPRREWGDLGNLGNLEWWAVDLPGAGQTPTPEYLNDYRVRALAKALASRMVSRCAQTIWVGNSFGGWLAAWAAYESPKTTKALVLLGPSGFGPPPEPIPGRGPRGEITLEWLKEFQKRAYHQPREIPDSVWFQLAERAKKSNLSDVMAAQVEDDRIVNKTAREWSQGLKAARTPVMWIWGESDRVTPLTSAEPEIKRLIQDDSSRRALVRWSECGHMLQKECTTRVRTLLGETLNNLKPSESI